MKRNSSLMPVPYAADSYRLPYIFDTGRHPHIVHHTAYTRDPVPMTKVTKGTDDNILPSEIFFHIDAIKGRMTYPSFSEFENFPVS